MTQPLRLAPIRPRDVIPRPVCSMCVSNSKAVRSSCTQGIPSSVLLARTKLAIALAQQSSLAGRQGTSSGKLPVQSLH